MTNTEARLVLTREAVEILGCSMTYVKTLAVTGVIKNWSLSPTSLRHAHRKNAVAGDRDQGCRLLGF
jgi:hypothetical protein